MSKAWLPQSDMYQKLQNWRIQISNLIILLKKSKGCAKKTKNVSANRAKSLKWARFLELLTTQFPMPRIRNLLDACVKEGFWIETWWVALGIERSGRRQEWQVEPQEIDHFDYHQCQEKESSVLSDPRRFAEPEPRRQPNLMMVGVCREQRLKQ